ncbi:MAG: prepilin-type N-terminal cleavage/methylation domain-containing protein [Tissierellia bacterium]|nr:prepilin-type N-terminal cleavage/methylation domain-containing protein [Tissierellia bacterium]
MKKLKGFTLLELVIVLGILALLLTIAIPKYQIARKQAEITAHNGNVKMLKTAGMLYLTEHESVTNTTLGEGELLQYIEGDTIPKPARGHGDQFTVQIDENGNVIVEPGELSLSNNDDSSTTQ